MIEPYFKVVIAPQRGHGRGHAKRGGRRLVLLIAEDVRVAIGEARKNRLRRQVDDGHAGGSERPDARNAVTFDTNVNVGLILTTPRVQQTPGMDRQARHSFRWSLRLSSIVLGQYQRCRRKQQRATEAKASHKIVHSALHDFWQCQHSTPKCRFSGRAERTAAIPQWVYQRFPPSLPGAIGGVFKWRRGVRDRVHVADACGGLVAPELAVDEI